MLLLVDVQDVVLPLYRACVLGACKCVRRKAEDEGECVWCVYVRERQKETGVQSDRGKERERERGGVTGSGRAEIGRGEERGKRRERERDLHLGIGEISLSLLMLLFFVYS